MLFRSHAQVELLIIIDKAKEIPGNLIVVFILLAQKLRILVVHQLKLKITPTHKI